jgi:signal transduction histidine kinase
VKEISTDPEITGRILVVDDEPRNRELLRDLLELEGHSILEATSGQEAIDRLAAEPTDLVLLDVNMPVMNGFEATRRIRSDPRTASLPILLVTALSDRDQRLKGIAAGANDYVVKPIDGPDLRLRVRNALHLRRLHTELAARYEELTQLENLRDSLVHMIVHDLRSPLTGLLAYLQLIELDLGAAGAAPELLQSISEARVVAHNLSDMITNVLDVNRLEAGAMPLAVEPVELEAIITAAVAGLGGPALRGRIRIENAAGSVTLQGDRILLRRVIVNLLANALKFSPPEEAVIVRVKPGSGTVTILVIDRGPGVPDEFREQIFEKFGQLAAAENRSIPSTGLGLTFCKLAVAAHGGSIGVESEVGQGSSFWVTLPTTSERVGAGASADAGVRTTRDQMA